MSEKMDPEDVTDVMNGCFQMLERIIRERGGTVDKYIGDCVMALFGAEHVVENSAAQAVQASLEMMAGLERFNDERSLPVPLKVHIGVNTGLVIAGEVGGDVKRDFTVMGDTVNLAARLEDASEKGQIFVGPETYSTTHQLFEYRPLEPLSLKGKEKPVQAYEVLAPKRRDEVPRLGKATRKIAADLVGRDTEIGELRRAMTSVLRGDGRIVNLCGEAGLGKSRLLLEASKDEILDRATVLVGRSQSVGARESFHSFVEQLQQWASIEDEDPESVAFEKLAAHVSEAVGEATPEVLPFVATLMGIPLDEASARRIEGISGDPLEKLITKAMFDLLVSMAGRTPLVLCFEDLHWADQSTLGLLESMLRLVEDHSVLFLLVFRPDFADTSGRIADFARNRFGLWTVDVELTPLGPREAQTLVRKLLRIEDLPYATRDLIARKAEGNPFFIEEVVRVLIDQEAIAVEEGRLRVTDRIHDVAIPGTIQEVIAVRVDQLDATVRHVLELGAVSGRGFYHRVLERLVGENEVDLEQALATLKERQIVNERRVRRTGTSGPVLLAPEREYVFHHALIQETVYETLTNRAKRRWHFETAKAIEAAFEDRLPDFYGVLALHYVRAESLAEAEDYLMRAGEEATRSAASSEALRYFREAYRIHPVLHGEKGDPEKKAVLEKNLAYALLLTGNLEESIPYFDRSLEYLGERRRYRTNRQAYLGLGMDLARIFSRVYLRRGRMSRRVATPEQRAVLGMLYDRARAQSVTDPERFLFDQMRMTALVTSVDPESVDQAFALYAGAALLFAYSGLSFRVSRRFGEVGAKYLREDHAPDLFTYRLMLAMCDYFEGAWDEPTGVDESLIQQILRTGQLWDVDTFLGIDAERELDRGNLGAARERLQLIGRLLGEYGYRFAETNRDALTTFVALQERRLDDALAAVEVYAEHPIDMLQMIALGTKAKIHTLRGESEAAHRTLAQAESVFARAGQGTPFHTGAFRTAWLLQDVSDLEAAVRDNDGGTARRIARRARGHAKAALQTAGRMARIRTETHRHIGSLAWLRGKKRKAAASWTEAIDVGRRLGARPELARTHLEIARRIGGESGFAVAGIGGPAHLEEARRLFAETNLQRELAEVESVRAECAA